MIRLEIQRWLDIYKLNSNGELENEIDSRFLPYVSFFTDFNDDEGIDAGDMHTLLDILTTNDLVQGEKDEIISKASYTVTDHSSSVSWQRLTSLDC